MQSGVSPSAIPVLESRDGRAAGGLTAVDIGHALDMGHWSGFQKRVLAMAALSFTVDGLANLALGLAIPSMVASLHVPRSIFALVAALGLIGVAVGTAIGGILGDRLGRRWTLICSVLLFGAMTAASAAIQHVFMLGVLRTLAGLGLGGAIPSATALIAEYTPIRRRSMAIAIGMVFIPIGGVIAAASASFVLPMFGWRGLFLFAGTAPLLLSAALIFTLPESPRYLLRRRHRRPELLRVLARLGYGFTNETPLVDGSHGAVRTPMAALFGPERRRDTMALWSAFFLWLLATYTFFNWAPAMLAGRGFGMVETSLAMTAFNVGGMLGSFAGGWTIERFGSRISMLGLSAGGILVALALALLPFGLRHHFVPLLFGLSAEGLFVSGVQNGMYAVAAHLYPPTVRATGIGSASGVGRVGAVVSAFAGIITLDLGGAPAFFLFIALAMGLTMVALLYLKTHIAQVDRRVTKAPMHH